ncbi:hypothetical protein EI74_0216 [Mycoplasma testudineum]|uniref:Uncharacterized protein n=1 Tax=Mycoplasma testudineum TaxID=244584 RepID=A0A4R6IHT5_9MOLU|nr:hypothetical protein [Mycoplasma testudineum]OYD27060.1 hypothetical protein CG473_00195 [Mycoplasma testudineum]TDO21185.1 hypothetical protein EI74_0216 [Mycoplasma testudineum]
MADKNKSQRWYCTYAAQDDGKFLWSLKKAKEEPIGVYQYQRDAVNVFKDLNITATLWFQKEGKFVRTIKTIYTPEGEEKIVIDSDDSDEVQEEAKRKLKERQKAEKSNIPVQIQEPIKTYEKEYRDEQAQRSKVEKKLEKSKASEKTLEMELARLIEENNRMERQLSEKDSDLSKVHSTVHSLEKELEAERSKTQELALQNINNTSEIILIEERNRSKEYEEKLALERKARLAAEREIEEINQTKIIELRESELLNKPNDDEVTARMNSAEAKIRELERRLEAKRKLEKSNRHIGFEDKTSEIILSDIEANYQDDHEAQDEAKRQRELLNNPVLLSSKKHNNELVEKSSEADKVWSENDSKKLDEMADDNVDLVKANPEDEKKLWGLSSRTWLLIAKTFFVLAIIFLVAVIAIAVASGFVA